MKKHSVSNYVSEFVPKFWLSLRQGYSLHFFRHDLLAGVTVGIVALPLSMAFAIASGLSPIQGLYTAIIAGFLISFLGGSYFQIGGPTGAFVVIIYEIVAKVGYAGLVITTLIGGLILIVAGLSKMGGLIKYIPYPLITGFTSGIAIIIFFSQIKDFFGLQIEHLPGSFIPKCIALFSAMPTWQPHTLFLALGTLILILIIRQFIPIIPWGITSIIIATAISWGFHLPVETIASRFGELPRTLPTPSLPDFSFAINNWSSYIPDAITIAFLAGIESLLSAVVADGMTGRHHRSNSELLAQGIANISSIIFGGIPATGAIARTATNIKSGAKTPISGIIHSVTLLLILLFLAPAVSQIPLAALSAVLVMVAWNMSEIRHFRHLFKAPAGDIIVLLTTFFLTIVVDLVVAIEVGMITAAFLFMKRMKDLSKIAPLAKVKEEMIEHEELDPDFIENKQIPPHIEVYEITGTFFFGLADSLKSVLSNLEFSPKVFILRLRKIDVMDASGLHALMEFYYQCERKKTILILSGVRAPLYQSLKKFGLIDLIGKEQVLSHIDPSLKHAQTLINAMELKQ
ncbi:MAG: sulfate permease [Simkaniaceae bacterium]|nr:sulfate permease [Simkaniaceae bacterium]